MSIIEVQGSREITETLDGAYGSRTFRMDFWDGYPNVGLPTIGDAWDESNPYLKCYNVSLRQDDAWGWLVTCSYNTKPQGEDVVTESWEFGCEVLDTTRGMQWESTKTSVDVPVSTVYPVQTYILSMKVIPTSRLNLQEATGRLNDRKFRGYAKETMLFEGAEVRLAYNKMGEAMSIETQYRFTLRPRSHNDAWREARQLVVKDVPQYWQDYDPEAQHYTDGTEHTAGDPVYVTGPAGLSGWDKPKDPSTSNYRYQSCDFATLLGLPILDGDDPPGEEEPPPEGG